MSSKLDRRMTHFVNRVSAVLRVAGGRVLLHTPCASATRSSRTPAQLHVKHLNFATLLLQTVPRVLAGILQCHKGASIFMCPLRKKIKQRPSARAGTHKAESAHPADQRVCVATAIPRTPPRCTLSTCRTIAPARESESAVTAELHLGSSDQRASGEFACCRHAAALAEH